MKTTKSLHFSLDTLSKKYRMHSAWGFFTHKLCPLLYLDHVTCAYLESTFTNIHISTKHLKINLTYLDHNISSTNTTKEAYLWRRNVSPHFVFFIFLCLLLSFKRMCMYTHWKSKAKKNS